MNNLANRLRSERERLGFSQDEMAKIGNVGRTTQINYETGFRACDTSYLLRVAEVGVDIWFVLMGQCVAVDALPYDENKLLNQFRFLPKDKKQTLAMVAQGLTVEHEQLSNDVLEEIMPTKKRLFNRQDVSLGSISNELYVMAYNIEQTLLDAGAMPERDYTYLDVMRLAQPLLLERWKANNKMAFDVPNAE